ncbi:RIP metalloprotease RseP [Pacificimonas flava]|uniref:Zinc metalloprotease n=2 Tax=Pacificimonas TaxID=1960290 RepID=A0A219B6Y8_9SPHN|nr:MULTISPECIES: RIP metalloprotease RseP [Pacificimonas]MBZ6378596.1 RIP metalloprotease RseP [Pacificimonas aurantium]OWV34127.1 RIP metalloprotease RseP [Pacificimonas flava]
MSDTVTQPGFLFTVAMFFLMIGPLVTIHELGHYLAGRAFGTRIDSFSIGFGRRVAGWTDRRGTTWQLSWLPLGGYVKFAGDANEAGAGSEGLDEIPEAERRHYFAFKPLWQRALIVAAGPAINLVLAVFIFAGLNFAYGQVVRPPVVAAVGESTAAAEAGLQPGDRFISVDGSDIEAWDDLVSEVTMNPGLPMRVEIERGGEARTLTITPDVVEIEDRFGNRGRIGRLGVQSSPEAEVREAGPLRALALGVKQTGDTIESMVKLIGHLIAGYRTIDELGGPLKIGKISGEVATLGPPAFIGLMALISINLGFINLLPIPMLDGGHLALYAAEAVRGRPLPEQAQQWAFMAGFALVVSFMLVVTINDLASFGVFDRAVQIFG